MGAQWINISAIATQGIKKSILDSLSCGGYCYRRSNQGSRSKRENNSAHDDDQYRQQRQSRKSKVKYSAAASIALDYPQSSGLHNSNGSSSNGPESWLNSRRGKVGCPGCKEAEKNDQIRMREMLKAQKQQQQQRSVQVQSVQNTGRKSGSRPDSIEVKTTHTGCTAASCAVGTQPIMNHHQDNCTSIRRSIHYSEDDENPVGMHSACGALSSTAWVQYLRCVSLLVEYLRDGNEGIKVFERGLRFHLLRIPWLTLYILCPFYLQFTIWIDKSTKNIDLPC